MLNTNSSKHSCRSVQYRNAGREDGVHDARLIRTPFSGDARLGTTGLRPVFRDKKYVLYFGRFQLHKGFHTLAQALPRFLGECQDAYAALVGRDMETSLASSMASFARAQCGSSAGRLIIVENLPHSQLYPVIAGAHLVVLPSLIDNASKHVSRGEGFGQSSNRHNGA